MSNYVVTGGTYGIGKACCDLLKEAGHTVFNIDKVDGDLTADLALKDDRNLAVQTIIDKFGEDGIDGFISNAGVGPDEEDPKRLISLNYYAMKELVEAFFPLVRMKRGHIVVISSNSSVQSGLNTELVDSMCEGNDEDKTREYVKDYTGMEHYVAYQASKYAIARWTRRISGKYGARGVNINAVAPGATVSELTKRGLQHPIFKAGMASVPIPTCYESGGMIPTIDVANTITFLLSPESKGINGAVIFVDGGTDGLQRTERF